MRSYILLTLLHALAFKRTNDMSAVEKLFKDHPEILAVVVEPKQAIFKDINRFKQFFIGLKWNQVRVFENGQAVIFEGQDKIKGSIFGQNGVKRYNLLTGYLYDRKDIQTFKSLTDDSRFSEHKNEWAIIASDEGVQTMAHSDLGGGAPTMAIFEGEKEWHLLPPTGDYLEYVKEDDVKDLTNIPERTVVTLKAGQVIFLRPGTIHHVITKENTFGIGNSIFYPELTQEHVMNSLVMTERCLKGSKSKTDEKRKREATTFSDPYYDEKFRAAGIKLLKKNWKKEVENLTKELRDFLSSRTHQMKKDVIEYTYDIDQLQKAMIEKLGQLPNADKITDKTLETYTLLRAGTSGYTRNYISCVGQQVVDNLGATGGRNQPKEMQHQTKLTDAKYDELLAAMVILHRKCKEPLIKQLQEQKIGEAFATSLVGRIISVEWNKNGHEHFKTVHPPSISVTAEFEKKCAHKTQTAGLEADGVLCNKGCPGRPTNGHQGKNLCGTIYSLKH